MNFSFLKSKLLWVVLVLSLPTTLLFTSCKRRGSEVGKTGLNSQAFYKRYNKYVSEWLAKEKGAINKQLSEARARLAEAEPEQQETLSNEIKGLERELEKFIFRQSLEGFFVEGEESEIPTDLVWQNGMEQPDIGDSRAKKGGKMRYFWLAFPPTIRQIGSNSNNGSRGDLYDNVEMYLVFLHPETNAIIPGVAKEWAESSDGRTVYFRIDPEARFNDGHPVDSEDVLTWARLRLDDAVNSIFYKQYIREQFAQFKSFGPNVVAVTLPEPKPLLPYYCGAFAPAATHFYSDFSADFEERQQWVMAPTAGPYHVGEKDIVKGSLISQHRVQDWWAKDLKFYRYRFNADVIEWHVILELNKAWELFRAGELDYFPITGPSYYYDKSEMPAVYDGYVERRTWYNQYPRIPWGLYLNTAEAPLDNADIRRGIAYAANFEAVCKTKFRGDAQRLQGFTQGYGEITNPEVSARPYSVRQAKEAFARAGYTKLNSDGFLENAQGKQLQVTIISRDGSDYRDILGIIKEEGKRAGIDFILDFMPGSGSYLKACKKEHQAYFSAWTFTPPTPAYYEYFHSRNAYDDKGTLKEQTNNVFSYAEPEMDRLTENYRNARNYGELVENGHRIQEIVAEKDLFIPGYTIPFTRFASWRWVQWADSETTQVAPPQSYRAIEGYCYWIDDEIKKETLEAKASGKTFDEYEREYFDKWWEKLAKARAQKGQL